MALKVHPFHPAEATFPQQAKERQGGHLALGQQRHIPLPVVLLLLRRRATHQPSHHLDEDLAEVLQGGARFEHHLVLGVVFGLHFGEEFTEHESCQNHVGQNIEVVSVCDYSCPEII